MARHRSFTSSMNQLSRSMYRMARAAERNQRAQLRVMERQLKLQKKEEELQAHRTFCEALVKFENDIVSIHKNVSPRMDWQGQLTMRSFQPESEPDIEKVKSQAQLVAKRKANSILGLFSKTKRSELQQRAATIIAEAEKEAEETLAQYKGRQKELEEAHRIQEESRINEIRSIITGEPSNILNVLHNKFSSFDDMPVSFSTSTKVIDRNTVVIRLELPDTDVIPDNVAQLLKSGKLTTKTKSETAKNTLYVNMMCSLALRVLGEVFFLLPSVTTVQVEAYLSRHDLRDGHSKESTVLSCVCNRGAFERINLQFVSPLEAIRSFTTRLNLDRQMRLSEVIPFVQTEDETFDDNTVDLQGISPEGFELLIRDLCERMGMESIVTKASHDGGIDVVAVDPTPLRGGRFVIQCKRYKNVVPVDVVRDLYGAMTHENASKGIVITTSHFSPDCYTFAQGKPIDLIERKQLEKLLRDSGYKVLDSNII